MFSGGTYPEVARWLWNFLTAHAKRVALVVSHAANLLTVTGMQFRWQPHVLIVNRTGVGDGVVRAAFEPHGLAARMTSLARA